MFSQMKETLDNYKSFGPPSVSRALMNIEDEKIQQKVCKANKEENVREQSEKICRDVEDAIENSHDEEASHSYSDNGVEVVENEKLMLMSKSKLIVTELVKLRTLNDERMK